MKKLISIILSLSFLLTLVSCSATQNEKLERFSKSFFEIFDTASTITAYDKSQKDFEEHFNMFYEELETYSKLYDIYKSYDDVVNLKYVNENAGKAPVKVDKKIIDLLVYAKDAYEMTEGYTNICMGSVLSVWHDKREEGLQNPENATLPNIDELKEKSIHTDINNLIIDTENSTVFFADDKMTLDVGSVAKGFVVDRMCEFIKENNIWSSATISLGGNLKTVGYKNNDGKTKFIIGIESPDKSKEYLSKVSVANGLSVVTSGDYQRYYTVNGTRYCHIIDPNTLMPADKFTSVSVITDNSANADALSTALFIMDIEEGKQLVESLENVEVIWVYKNGKEVRSSGFSKYEVK